MKPDNKIVEELEEIAPVLAKLEKGNLYQVQEGYFSHSKARLFKITEMANTEYPVLAAIPEKELYTAPPVSYFESFSENIIARIHAEDVQEELSYTLPILEHITPKQLYTVPAGYFETFAAAMVHKAKEDAAGHHIPAATWLSKWVAAMVDIINALVVRPRYTFAMVSVVSVIVCIMLVVKPQGALTGDDKIFAQMQQLSDADLHHYFAKHRDDFDERIILHNINNVDFTHYFDKPEQVTPHIEGHTQNGVEDDINEEILD